MAIMAHAKQGRGGWLVKIGLKGIKKLYALLNKTDIDYMELSDGVKEFDLCLAACNISQTEFEYY